MTKRGVLIGVIAFILIAGLATALFYSFNTNQPKADEVATESLKIATGIIEPLPASEVKKWPNDGQIIKYRLVVATPTVKGFYYLRPMDNPSDGVKIVFRDGLLNNHYVSVSGRFRNFGTTPPPNPTLTSQLGYIKVEKFSQPFPSIQTISPSSGPVGTTVTLSGSGLTKTGNKIYFDNQPLAGADNRPSSDYNTLQFIVPQGQTIGRHYVDFSNQGGTSTWLPDSQNPARVYFEVTRNATPTPTPTPTPTMTPTPTPTPSVNLDEEAYQQLEVRPFELVKNRPDPLTFQWDTASPLSDWAYLYRVPAKSDSYDPPVSALQIQPGQSKVTIVDTLPYAAGGQRYTYQGRESTEFSGHRRRETQFSQPIDVALPYSTRVNLVKPTTLNCYRTPPDRNIVYWQPNSVDADGAEIQFAAANNPDTYIVYPEQALSRGRIILEDRLMDGLLGSSPSGGYLVKVRDFSINSSGVTSYSQFSDVLALANSQRTFCN